MPFVISELVIEQLVRNGLEDLRNNVDIALEDIFHNLTSDLLNSKFAEDVEKIKVILLEGQVHILHAFPQADTQLPSFSIHLQSDSEETPLDVLGDFSDEAEVDIDPEVIIDPIAFTSFDEDEKIAYVDDSVNLSSVYYNRWLVFPDETEIRVLESNNTTGNKYIKLDTDLDVISMSGNKIVSAIDTRKFSEHEIPSRENIMIGVHTQNSLLTKYLYHILKYILYKNRENFWNKGIRLQVFRGSDFAMDTSFLPVQMFSRFLTMDFVAGNSWRHSELVPIDSLGYDTTINTGTIKFEAGPQPSDGQYKTRIEREEDYPREGEDDLTVGTQKKDD